MRKHIKQNLLDIIKTMYEAHGVVKGNIESGNFDDAVALLSDCQNTAVDLGSLIEETEGEDTRTVTLLEEYCDELYNSAVSISENENVNSYKLCKNIDKKLRTVENSVHSDIKVRLEVVFMPYKASMWDSLESVWKAADEDPECDAYVVPIPYYDRTPHGTFGEYHYEGNEFPEYVTITHYDAYDLEKRIPDVIYIHNPYDNNNFVTSVDPRFYSFVLKKYTDKLVYIPYFVLAEPNPDNPNDVEVVSHFALTSGVINADEVIVQSEAMRQTYIKILLNRFGDTPENRKVFDNKILGSGSPKFDKITETTKDNVHIPDEWLKIIKKPDGTWKKIFFYNTGISGILNNDWKCLDKIENTFNVFQHYRSAAVLLWRPHPLIESTIKSMRPHLYERYIEIKHNYIKNNYGIFDNTADLDRAIAISDAYFGDTSSLTHLFKKQNKPILLQTTVLTDLSCNSSMINIEFENVYEDDDYFWFTSYNFNGLFRSDKVTRSVEFMGSFPNENIYTKRLYATIIEHDNKLYFTPLRAKEIGVYDKIKKKFSKISYNESDKDKLFLSAEWNYYYALKHENCIYFFPHQRKSVLKYDLNNNTLTKITEWTKSVLSACKSLYCIYSRVTMVGNKIYAPISGTNALEIIDIENNNTELFTIGEEGSTYSDICIVGNKCYLSPLYGTEIIEWDLNLKKTTRSISVPNANKNKLNFRAVEKQDNILYFFPHNYDKVIHINLDDRELTAKTDNVFNKHYESCSMCSCADEGVNICIDVCQGKICIYSYITKEFIIFDAGSVCVEKVGINLYDDSLTVFNNYINNCLKERIAHSTAVTCEDSFLNLKSYIESIIL